MRRLCADRPARSAVAELQGRVTELDSEEGRADLRQAYATIADLTAKAARAEALEVLLAAQRETVG